MSLLPLAFFLALLLPGLALARRLAPRELRGGLLPSIAVSWATLLVVLLPVVIAGYLMRLPAGALGALLVLLVVWGAVDLARAPELREREGRRAILGAVAGAASLAMLVVAADLWLSYRHGAILDNDSRVHIARIRFLVEHGLSNADPFVRTPHEYPYPIYHTNLWHALVAAFSAVLRLDPVEVWFNALVVSKVMIATGLAYLAWVVVGGRWAPWIASAMIVVNRGPYTFSLYPNQLAPWAVLPVAVGVLLRALAPQRGDDSEEGRRSAWRTVAAVGGTALLVGAFHPMYGGFLAVLATPVAAATALVRIVRRRPARTALLATVAVALGALAFPLVSRALTAEGVDPVVARALENREWRAKRDAMRAEMRRELGGGAPLATARPKDADTETAGLGRTERDLVAAERVPDPDARAAAAAAAAQGPADDAAGNAPGAEANSAAAADDRSAASTDGADAPKPVRRHRLIRPTDGFDFYDRGGASTDWLARSPWRGFLGGFGGLFWWRVWLALACGGLAAWRLRRIEPILLAGTVLAVEAVVLIPPVATAALKFLGAVWILGRFETLAFVLWIPLSLPALAALVESLRPWRAPAAVAWQTAICALAIPLAWFHASHRAPYDWTRYRAEAMKSEGFRVGRQLAGLRKNQAWMNEVIPDGATVLAGTLTGTWVAMLRDAALVASERSSTGVPGGRLRRVHVDEMFSPETDEGRRADLFRFYGITHVLVGGRTPVWARYWTVGGKRGHGHVLLTLRPAPDEELLWLREVMVASAQLDRGNARWALERIEPVVRDHPESAEAHFTFGNALMALRTRLDDAEAAYRKALELAPDEPLHALMLGNALAAQGRHDEAAEAFERAVARATLDSNRAAAAAAAFNKGNSLYALDRFDEALASYERALSFDPLHAKAIRARGWLREDLGLDPPAQDASDAEGDGASAPAASPAP
ncbi:MAG: hypothetical protein RI967_1896 [Planctomycetota bacterium]